MESGNIGGISESKARVKYSRVKRRVLKHVWLIRIILLSLVSTILIFFCFLVFLISKNLGVGNFIKLFGSFITADASLIQSENGLVNILVMGIGGEGHEGSTLTDTMLVASISLEQPKVKIISIPRDLWIPGLRAKINSAYYWGEQKSEGSGISLARTTVEEVIGQQLQYGVVIDFAGFTKIIDVLDGVNVNVKQGFTDPMYPIAGRENDLCDGDLDYKCRYESITFESGLQKMNGERALKFVRSRHAEGDEGTDFARSARQQQVISAIKDRVLMPEIFLSPKKINSLFEVVNSSTTTDINSESLAILARKIYDGRDSIDSYTIPEQILVNPPISPMYDRLYVFIPKAGNGRWNEIQDWVNTVLP